MTITVRDLKRLIEDMNDDIEVRFASQPNWPFEYSIEDVYVVDLNESSEDPEDQDPESGTIPDYEPNEVVYLVEGNQIGYLPGIVTKTIGW